MLRLAKLLSRIMVIDVIWLIYQVALSFTLLFFQNLPNSVRHHQSTICFYDLRFSIVSVSETTKRFLIQDFRTSTFVKLFAYFNSDLLLSHFFKLQWEVEADVFILLHWSGYHWQSPVMWSLICCRKSIMMWFVTLTRHFICLLSWFT